MKRLFIATKITLSPEYRELVSQLRHELRHNDIVWVKDDVCHLTLRFLGPTPDNKIPALKETLAKVCAQNEFFNLRLCKLGAFGSRYKPEILWLGFDDFTPFREMFDALETQLLAQAWPPAYGNFVPHITLCRIKQVLNKQRFWKSVENLRPNFSQNILIEEMTLYQSFLHAAGPEYKPLASYSLKNRRS